jgi:hypothetical protein
MPLVVILLLAFVLTKAITTHREEMTYARQGQTSPRYQMKLAKTQASGSPAPARPGAAGYFRELWHDAWDDATERHHRIRDEKKAGDRPKAGQRVKGWWRRLGGWWHWAFTPIAERGAEPAVEPPVTGPQVEPPPTADVLPDRTGPRIACPHCGENLIKWGRDGWWHPDGPNCPVTGEPYGADQAIPTDPSGSADPTPGPESGGAGTQPQDDDSLRPDESPVAAQDEEPPPANESTNGGIPMTAPTGEAVNYETTVSELEKLAEEQRGHIDHCKAARAAVEQAKASINNMQESYRASAAAAATMSDQLAAKNLDGVTLANAGTTADAMPAGAVDAMYDQLEAMEEEAKARLGDAEIALGATEANLKHIVDTYGEENAKVASHLGGDASWLDSAGGAGASQLAGGNGSASSTHEWGSPASAGARQDAAASTR